MAANPTVPDTLIAQEARDLLPETWNALYEEGDNFGPAALQRRHNRVLRRIFNNEVPSAVEQEAYEAVDSRIIEYAGLKLAIALADPAIEYWSRQALSHTAGERESEAFKDRAEDLRRLKIEWTKAAAELEVEIGPLLPLRPGPAKASPQVRQAGETFAHLTPDPFSIPPAYGPPEETIT